MTSYKFRRLKLVNWSRFIQNIQQSVIFANPATTAGDTAAQSSTNYLEQQCLLVERRRFTSIWRDHQWLSPLALEVECMKTSPLWKKWKISGSVDNYIAYQQSCWEANNAIILSRGEFHNERIRIASGDPRRRWCAIRNMLHLGKFVQITTVPDLQMAWPNSSMAIFNVS